MDNGIEKFEEVDYDAAADKEDWVEVGFKHHIDNSSIMWLCQCGGDHTIPALEYHTRPRAYYCAVADLYYQTRRKGPGHVLLLEVEVNPNSGVKMVEPAKSEVKLSERAEDSVALVDTDYYVMPTGGDKYLGEMLYHVHAWEFVDVLNADGSVRRDHSGEPLKERVNQVRQGVVREVIRNGPGGWLLRYETLAPVDVTYTVWSSDKNITFSGFKPVPIFDIGNLVVMKESTPNWGGFCYVGTVESVSASWPYTYTLVDLHRPEETKLRTCEHEYLTRGKEGPRSQEILQEKYLEPYSGV